MGSVLECSAITVSANVKVTGKSTLPSVYSIMAVFINMALHTSGKFTLPDLVHMIMAILVNVVLHTSPVMGRLGHSGTRLVRDQGDRHQQGAAHTPWGIGLEVLAESAWATSP